MKIFAAFLLLAAAAAAQESEAPDKVLAAVEANDAQALRALAARGHPDPWLVAEELCQRGEHEAAAAFARLVKSKWAPRLPAYVAARRGIEVPPAAVAARREADALLKKKKPAEALALLAKFDRPLRDVNAIRLAYRRGRAFMDLRRFPEATDAFAKTAEAADELGWLQEAALAYEKAAHYAQFTSALPRARRYAQRRLDIVHLEPRPAQHAAANFHLGILLDQMGDYLEAIRHLERARVLHHGRKDETGELNSLTFLAQAHLHLGDAPKALATAKQALAMARPKGDATLAVPLTVTGACYLALGEYAQAEEILREGLTLDLSAVGWAAELLRSRFLAELGMVCLRRGDLSEALGWLEREFRIKDKSTVLAGVAANLNNRALVYTLLGDFERAAEFYERAHALCEKEGNHVLAASILSNAGFIKVRQDDPDGALAVFRKAQAVLADSNSKAQLPTVVGNIGFVQWQAGRYDEAIASYHEALRLAREVGDTLTAARVIGNRAAVLNKQGKHDEAIAARRRALAEGEALGATRLIYENSAGLAQALLDAGRPAEAVVEAKRAVETVQRLVAHLGDEQGPSARAQFSDAYGVGTRAALATDDTAALCHFLESGRAGTLLESLGGRSRLRASAVPEELRAAEAEALAAEKVAEFAFRQAHKQGNREAISAGRRERAKARERLRRVVERVQREARRAAALLYPKAAPLAEIQATLRAGDALVLYSLLEEGAFALVVTTDGARAVRLGGTIEIEAAAARVRADPASLRRLAVAPLRLGDAIQRVLVSPDGVLSYVPFALLFPKRSVAYVPSGTTYRLLTATRSPPGQKVLALGDPKYPRAMRLAALPGTRAEAQAVGDVLLLGEDATEAGLRAALGEAKQWRALHLGCHGFVNTTRPTLSSLALTPADGDGYLRALDVYRMRIPADLVVLSACDTARGKIYKAEGVVGFTSAFLFAGAPRVIVSLWKVDDEATCALMVKFYENWKTQPTATALKNAQAFVRGHDKWRDPRYWAAWQLWGLPD